MRTLCLQRKSIRPTTRTGEPRQHAAEHRRSKPPRQSLRYAYRSGSAALKSDPSGSADGESPGIRIESGCRGETLRLMTEGEFTDADPAPARTRPGELMTDPRYTILRDRHEALGASFTDFGGWAMPVRYTSDLAEHHAVRTAAGLFDISHMAEFFVSGGGAADFLDYALAGPSLDAARGAGRSTRCCWPGAGGSSTISSSTASPTSGSSSSPTPAIATPSLRRCVERGAGSRSSRGRRDRRPTRSSRCRARPRGRSSRRPPVSPT